MEDVLEVYSRPYNPKKPVICTDEMDKQCIKEVKTIIPAIEAFGMMFGEITCELDAGGIWEYIEERKEFEWLEPHERPKNVPKYHWWWFTEFKSRGFCL